jgi:hypothetical protein
VIPASEKPRWKSGKNAASLSSAGFTIRVARHGYDVVFMPMARKRA